jgi:hypothetical protein
LFQVSKGAKKGRTLALSGAQAKRLLDAPDGVTLKGKRDCAIPAVLLYHALRRDELCKPRVTFGGAFKPLPFGKRHLR